MIKAINSRIPTVAPTQNVGNRSKKYFFYRQYYQTMVEKDVQEPVGLRDNATTAFYASNYQFQGTIIPFDLSYQMQIILQELRRIIPKSNMYYSWTQL
nr:BPK_HP1_G0058230.mRNA.1.CDS.1 [Saccharomyces cerevisiae]